MYIHTKKIVILISVLMLSMIYTARAETFPSFPMAFWGNVTIDNSPVARGYTIKAYYGSDLAGSTTINEVGVYGYSDSLKQKLIIKDGVGQIAFKLSLNGADANVNPIYYQSFVAGETINKNLGFITKVTATTAPVGGGGGGGGGGYIPAATTTTTVTTKPGTITTTTKPIGKVLGAVIGPVTIPTLPPNPTLADYQNLLTALIQQLAYLQSLEPTSGYKFNKNLQLGNSGEDVRQLQMFLKSQGTDIYPEGLITGYFGSLTKRAVERFQVKYGIANPGEAGYGLVGPRTRAKINSLQGL